MAYIEDWTCEECLCLGCDRDYCTCLDEGWCCECRCGEEPDDEGDDDPLFELWDGAEYRDR